MSSTPTGRHTIVPVPPRRRLSARPRPAAVSPGHPDLHAAQPARDADTGRRLEEVVALEARRAQERRLT